MCPVMDNIPQRNWWRHSFQPLQCADTVFPSWWYREAKKKKKNLSIASGWILLSPRMSHLRACFVPLDSRGRHNPSKKKKKIWSNRAKLVQSLSVMRAVWQRHVTSGQKHQQCFQLKRKGKYIFFRCKLRTFHLTAPGNAIQVRSSPHFYPEMIFKLSYFFLQGQVV